MVDQTSPFSFNIRQAFLDYITKDEDSFVNISSEEESSVHQDEIENHPPLSPSQIVDKQ